MRVEYDIVVDFPGDRLLSCVDVLLTSNAEDDGEFLELLKADMLEAAESRKELNKNFGKLVDVQLQSVAAKRLIAEAEAARAAAAKAAADTERLREENRRLQLQLQLAERGLPMDRVPVVAKRKPPHSDARGHPALGAPVLPSSGASSGGPVSMRTVTTTVTVSSQDALGSSDGQSESADEY